MSPGRIAVMALVLAVVGGAWAVVAFTGDDHAAPDALLLETARPEAPVTWQDVTQEDDPFGGPDPTGDRSVASGEASGDDDT
jgi:hypothetical protein